MRLFRILLLLIVILGACAGGLVFWSSDPITIAGAPLEFTVPPGSSIRVISQDIADAGVPINPFFLDIVARATRQAERLKAGTYAVPNGLTPLALLDKMVKGDVVQIDLVIPEGWTFRQMRQAIAQAHDIRQSVGQLSDAELMRALGAEGVNAEGLFFPDTYRYARGTLDLELYRRAYRAMQKRLGDAWAARAAGLPLKTPYEALTLASIIEKETGRGEDRAMVGAVFVNRLKLGMLLQTDPTVIYGLGSHYDGSLHKKDLLTDTPYNTYTRVGLPPSPIALPSEAAIEAALNPANSQALYFVARGDGTSKFSENLDEHVKAVNKYQKGEHS